MTPTEEKLDRQIAYLHFPKTAGTTLGNVIVDRVESRAAFTSWREAEGETLADYQFVHGHLLYEQLRRSMPEDTFVMTNFRHPIERIYSLYKFRRRRPDDPEHEAAMTLSLAEFVEEGHGSQTYLHQLTDEIVHEPNGDVRAVPSVRARPERLQLAKDRIDTLDHVGISEYFDYSMLLLAHDLGCEPFWGAMSMNAAPKVTTRDDLDEETIEVIMRVASEDIQLYRYALERFKNDLRTLTIGVREDD